MRNRLRLVSIVSLVGLGAAPASAQCPDWSAGFGYPGADDAVLASAFYDDGSGAALYVGGEFTAIGAQSAASIARADGMTWSEVGGGTNGLVEALAVFDDGFGSALYAAGTFTSAGGMSANRIAKWNGSTWSTLGSGTNGAVHALAVFDDGGGPALYAGGQFSNAGGGAASDVARWNGSTWSALGSGTNGVVFALLSFDNSSGPALYVGGDFTAAGGSPASHVARWDGSTWSAMGLGVNSTVYALAGLGGSVFVGGHFRAAGGAPALAIAAWTSSSWSPLPPGLNKDVRALAVHDDGSGGKLIVGGEFSYTGPLGMGVTVVNHLATWTGAEWLAYGGGVGQNNAASDVVRTILSYDDGSGPKLLAGGEFDRAANRVVTDLASFDGAQWLPLTAERGNGGTHAMLGTSTGPESGARLYGATGGGSLTRLDRDGWRILGTANSVASIRALADHDDGSGPAIFVGGQFITFNGVSARGIARWNGATFSAVGGGFSGAAPLAGDFERVALASDPAPVLYVGGNFSSAGGVTTNHVAKWNGSVWQNLGAGVGGGSFPVVYALASFDDGLGDGVVLYAAGTFTTAGGSPAARIARWNGATWSALGSGLNGDASALEVFDDGSGPALYVGGAFTTAGATSANRVARWNGTTWSTVSIGTNDVVWALEVFDDGTGAGPALYAGGEFTLAGGIAATALAKWDGVSWSTVASGLSGGVFPFGPYAYTLEAFHDGTESGPDLWVTGGFTHAGRATVAGTAKLSGCGVPGVSYCFGDDLDPLVTADCPCGNFGEPYHGCGNFPFTNGALLTASGTTSPNTILFTCTDLPNNTLCTFLRGGNNVPAGFVFGDGVRCVQTPLLRFGQQNSGVGGNPPSTAITATLVEAPGVTRYYQCQYRNPVVGWCDPGLFNVSNGYRLNW